MRRHPLIAFAGLALFSIIAFLILSRSLLPALQLRTDGIKSISVSLNKEHLFVELDVSPKSEVQEFIALLAKAKPCLTCRCVSVGEMVFHYDDGTTAGLSILRGHDEQLCEFRDGAGKQFSLPKGAFGKYLVSGDASRTKVE